MWTDCPDVAYAVDSQQLTVNRRQSRTKKEAVVAEGLKGGWMRGPVVAVSEKLDGSPRTKVVSLRLAQGVLRKLLFHELADRLAVDALSGKLRHRGFHHPSHVFRGRRAGLGNRIGDRAIDVGAIGGGRQVRFEHAHLGRFLLDEILTSTLGELLDRILPLLDERGD